MNGRTSSGVRVIGSTVSARSPFGASRPDLKSAARVDVLDTGKAFSNHCCWLDMPITIAEVARAAGVSKTTVSLVLNGRHRSARISEATRESVAESALRRGYQPNYAAWSLRRRRSNVVTLLV